MIISKIKVRELVTPLNAVMHRMDNNEKRTFKLEAKNATTCMITFHQATVVGSNENGEGIMKADLEKWQWEALSSFVNSLRRHATVLVSIIEETKKMTSIALASGGVTLTLEVIVDKKSQK